MASRLSGGSKLRRQLRQWPDHLTSEIKAEIRLIGQEGERALELGAPRDEGRLSIAAHHVVSSDGLSVKMGYSSGAGFKRQWAKGGFEAIFQEFGTKFHPAQEWIRRVWHQRVGGWLNRIDARVNASLRKAGEL